MCIYVQCDEKYLGQTDRGKTVYPAPGECGYNYLFLMKSYWSEISNYGKFHTLRDITPEPSMLQKQN
jgi:hypothetical protein